MCEAYPREGVCEENEEELNDEEGESAPVMSGVVDSEEEEEEEVDVLSRAGVEGAETLGLTPSGRLDFRSSELARLRSCGLLRRAEEGREGVGEGRGGRGWERGRLVEEKEREEDDERERGVVPEDENV